MIQKAEEQVSTATEGCPKGYHSINSYVTCTNARREIDFLVKALGAREKFRLDDADDPKRLTHAELEIGDSILMLGDVNPTADIPVKAAKDLGGSPVSFYLYVADVDATFAQCTKAGAQVKRPVQDMFYGDRVGSIQDPEGILWSLATHKRDVSPEEMKAGAAALKKQKAASGAK
jgi:uncharacterized glyoxalase superfamily protein PhnB